MSDHFGTLCIKGLKAINIGNSLISGGLDNDRILYFIFCQKIYTPNLSTTLGLEIFRHILSKILTNSKKISPPPPSSAWHTLALALLHSVPYFFFLCWSPSLYLCIVFDSISSNIGEVLSINPSANVLLFFFNCDLLHARLNSH